MFESVTISHQKLSDKLAHRISLCKNKKTEEEFFSLDVFYDGMSYLLNYTYEKNLEGTRRLQKQAGELTTDEEVEKEIGIYVPEEHPEGTK